MPKYLVSCYFIIPPTPPFNVKMLNGGAPFSQPTYQTPVAT
jgi:hypothetical protein